MIVKIQFIGMVIWLFGLMIENFNGGFDNIDTTYRTLWAIRSVAVGDLIYIISSFILGNVNSVFMWSVIMLDVVIFLVYARKEYKAREIYNVQAKEYFKD